MIRAPEAMRIEGREAVGMADLTRAFAVRNRSTPAGILAIRHFRMGLACLAALVLLAAASLISAAPASALEAIVIGPDQERIDLSVLAELYAGRGDRFSVETAPGQDGVAGRMAVSAKTEGTNPNWAVFALNNPTDQTVTLWLMAQRYDLLGSKVVWPDLDAPRVSKVTVSLGFKPERLDNDYADVYRLVLEPGSTVTYIVELGSVGIPRLYLANPINSNRASGVDVDLDSIQSVVHVMSFQIVITLLL